MAAPFSGYETFCQICFSVGCRAALRLGIVDGSEAFSDGFCGVGRPVERD